MAQTAGKVLSQDAKQHAHTLIDQMAPSQVTVALVLLEKVIAAQVSPWASAPFEDEELSEEEKVASARAMESIRNNDSVQNDEILAMFGLTSADFERMGQTPFESTSAGK